MASEAILTTGRISRLAGITARVRQLWLPWVPLTVMVALIVCAAFAPLLATQDPNDISMLDRRIASSQTIAHPLGTDIMGRDMLARLIYGARVSVFISLAALSAGVVVGTVLGLVAGYRGGWLDGLIMRTTDAALGFPTILVAMIVVTILGAGIENIILAVVLTVWPGLPS